MNSFPLFIIVKIAPSQHVCANLAKSNGLFKIFRRKSRFPQTILHKMISAGLGKFPSVNR